MTTRTRSSLGMAIQRQTRNTHQCPHCQRQIRASGFPVHVRACSRETRRKPRVKR